ncbi:MAG: ATP-dependent Lon protease [Nitrospirae bacterium]|nr:MAG: ATP-dependent Lon protease [Nitrospirota bacterium]
MKFFRKSEESQPDSILEELRKKIETAQMPADARKIADKELEILNRIGPATSEYTIGLTYIEYLVSLPWGKKTEDNLDIDRVEKILDEDHYGLHKIKERILEHLAVRKLKMARKPRILVVDDEEVARKNLAHILSKENYTVSTAANGMEALKKMAQSEFDVILTDFKMEKIDGMEILERTKTKFPETEVIMITGYATIDTAVEAMKKGAFHYIAKPFKLDEAREIVAQALDKKSLRKESKGSVLCFAGPPGTGKTSLGRSIARSLGRKFARISLGGIKDEAEIRGHRKTYAGAMPGRIIEEIRRTESLNPVIILDEMDKIGYDVKGDPASALLEVLDPEQNSDFIDHYLDVSFDLSGVMFIITANIADNIIDVLRDRMEVIQFSGYTEEEKVKIASQFLIPRQIKETGLSDYPPEFAEETIYKIIQKYTREAGIRNLEREIASVCRKIAKDLVRHDKHSGSIRITPDMTEKFLGPRKYYFEVAEEKDMIGITTGLVWTEIGGDIISIEAVKMQGKQKLILTGSLGDVMRESAQAALSYIRSNAGIFGIQENFFEGHDVHIHVPAGAIPKDGPSAGAAIAMALLSLLTGRPAKRDVAISAELTLSGRLLPVGGIKEKILAARRAGLKTVILPSKNRGELENIPEDIQKDLRIIFEDKIEDVVELVLS